MNKQNNVLFLIFSFLCTVSLSAMDPMDIDSDDEEDTEMDYVSISDLKELTSLNDKQTELHTTTEPHLKDSKSLSDERIPLSQEKSALISEFQKTAAPVVINSLKNMSQTLDAITIDTSDDSPAKKTLAFAKIKYKKNIDNMVNILKEKTDFHPRKMDSWIKDAQLFVTILGQLDKESADEVVAKLQKEEFIPQDSENTHNK